VTKPIEVTVLRKDRGILSKRISLVDGKVVSDGSACAMSHGRAKRHRVNGLDGLAELIGGLPPVECLCLCPLRADLDDDVEIATKDELDNNPEATAVARTAKNLSYRAGEPAFGYLDYDLRDIPEHVLRRVADAGGYWSAVVAVRPGLAGAGHVSRRSTSSGLSNADTGEVYRGSAGVHEYFEAEDGGDIRRFLYALHDYAVAAGFGWYMIDAAGKLHERSLVDRMVGHDGRLTFEGRPIVEPPLKQDAASRRPEVFPGERIDTRAVAPPPSPADLQAKARVLAEDARRVEPERKRRREAYLDKEVAKFRARDPGATIAEARASVEKRIDGGILSPDVVLPFDAKENLDDGTAADVTVEDVLDDPESFVGLTLADPIEGVAYGRGKATIMIGDDGLPFINSFAHGGRVYRLRYDARTIARRIEAAEEKVETFVKMMIAADVDVVEEEKLIKAVKKLADVDIPAIKAKLKEARAEQNQRRGANGFAVNDHGRPFGSQGNIRKAMEILGVGVRYDRFNNVALIDGLDGHTVFDDPASAKLWLLIDERFGFLPVQNFFDTVVAEAARRCAFHPVLDYLDSLTWDGVPRLDRWLVDYGGAATTEYACTVGAITLVAAVRRVRKPGCKFDEMLILENPQQGTDKSTTLKVLAVRESWFSDDLPLSADAKRVIEQTSGKWIIEASELSGMRRGAIEHVKAMLSRTTDHARLSYGRHPTERARQFIVVGTTNAARYLRDTTGNRRFWPVRVARFDLAALARDRDQLWAEAAAREASAGASIRLEERLWAAAGQEQDERLIDDPWLDVLSATIGSLNGKIVNADAWTIVGLSTDRRNQDHNERLGSVMKLLNFERKNLRIEGEKAWCYVRGTDAERERRIYVRKNFDDDAPYCSNLTKEEEEEEERRRSEEERRRRELHVVTGGREG
jgi:hypothetical protein